MDMPLYWYEKCKILLTINTMQNYTVGPLTMPPTTSGPPTTVDPPTMATPQQAVSGMKYIIVVPKIL